MQESANNPSMLPVGTILRGIYRIDSYLSSGGFGNTYIATNIEFDERIAIKEFFMKGINQREGETVTVSVADNETTFNTQKEKLKKEARRLRQLKNEHIVSVHDLFEERGTVYYVMDYIDGESLAARLKRDNKPLSEAETLRILDQVLNALSLVHGQKPQLLHLDIKPANIMVDKEGNAYLIDFGASKQLTAEENLTLSTSTGMSYTAGYAPIEQIEQNFDRIGPWTDYYALGGTLYKLLTLKQPPTPSEISEDAEEAFDFPPSVSTKTQKLVRWMMTPNRKMRPQSVEDIRVFLDDKPEKTVADDDDEATIYVTPGQEKEVKPAPEPKDIASKKVETKVEEEKIEETEEKNEDPIEEESFFVAHKKMILGAFAGLIVIVVAVIALLPKSSTPDHQEEGVDINAQINNVVLNDALDSLAYTTGLAQSKGLKEYLLESLGVDLTYLDDFSKGLVEAASNTSKEKMDYYQCVSLGISLETIADTVINGQQINRDEFFAAVESSIKNDYTRMTIAEASELYGNDFKGVDNDKTSYAFGLLGADGLNAYLSENLDVDTMQVDNVKQGLYEGFANDNDSPKHAYHTGLQIGIQLATQLIPAINNQVFGDGATKSISSKLFLSGFLSGVYDKNHIMSLDEAEKNAQELIVRFKENNAAASESVLHLHDIPGR